jgi:hypothetical protein
MARLVLTDKAPEEPAPAPDDRQDAAWFAGEPADEQARLHSLAEDLLRHAITLASAAPRPDSLSIAIEPSYAR